VEIESRGGDDKDDNNNDRERERRSRSPARQIFISQLGPIPKPRANSRRTIGAANDGDAWMSARKRNDGYRGWLPIPTFVTNSMRIIAVIKGYRVPFRGYRLIAGAASNAVVRGETARKARERLA